MKRIKEKNLRRIRRKQHIRKTVGGSARRPRLTVFRSNKNIFIQAIDDDSGKTIVSASTLDKETKEMKATVEGGANLGTLIGKRLLKKKIKEAVFDRNGYLYHGVVKAVADGARKAGIKF